MKPLLHEMTGKMLSEFIRKPSHALILSGPVGSGKGLTAAYLARTVLGINGKLENHTYTRWFHDQEKGISIEDIRNAQTFMQLKTPGKEGVRRVLIVEQGETMSTEAQNAFLKLLEEPPADSLIIITTTSLSRLLPTIRSRAQAVQILPPTNEQVEQFYSTNFSKPAITKAYYISEGYMGLMQALLEQDSSHQLVELIDTAKSILSGSSYQRLVMVDQLSKQKNTNLLLQALERVCHAALAQSIAKENEASKRWVARLKVVIAAKKANDHNAQSKLLLTDMMLNL